MPVSERLTRVDRCHLRGTGDILAVGTLVFLCLANLQTNAFSLAIVLQWLHGLRSFDGVFCAVVHNVEVNDVRLLLRLLLLTTVVGLRSIGLLIFVLVSRYGELHLIGDVTNRVHKLSYKSDGLRGEVCDKGQGYDDEHGDEPRTAYEPLEPLTDEETVVSAGVEDAVAHQWCDKLGECHRHPHHDESQAEEPFPEVQLRISAHALQSPHEDEYRNEECRDAETFVYEEV